MHERGMRSAREAALLARFAATYERMRAPVMAEIERAVCGCDYGGNSWTTRAQVERMIGVLDLRAGVLLLELGAGSGWPGLYMAQATGCTAMLADVPLSGLRLAAERAARDGLSARVSVVAADAGQMPFGDASFDAISHNDLLCCLEAKRAVLQACRRLIRPDGRMAFTVISVAAGLTAAARKRAVANGPEFIEAEAGYDRLLAETGWTVTAQTDITDEYAQSCRRQLEADTTHAEALSALIGAAAYEDRMAGWRAKLAAFGEGLLLRQMLTALPGPE